MSEGSFYTSEGSDAESDKLNVLPHFIEDLSDEAPGPERMPGVEEILARSDEGVEMDLSVSSLSAFRRS
jgi:hypothetical protein